MKKLFAATCLSIALLFINISGAFASDTIWVCRGPAYDPYQCTAEWGYVGHDSYNLEQWSSGSGDNKHGCTSFAGYLLWLFNVHYSGIYHFDAARSWDTEAPSLGHAVVGTFPRVGDIAQWDEDAQLPLGHVAFVKEVSFNSQGQVKSILVADDNFSLGYTSQRRIFPESSNNILSWPDHFLTFPSAPSVSGSGNGGGIISVVALLGTYIP